MTTVLCASSLGQQQSPEAVGEWAPVLSWPLQTIHGIVLKNGKVLCVADPIVDDGAKVRIWDPSTNTISVVADPPIDPDAVIPAPVSLFCSGHAQLADGRVVFFGGGPGYDEAHDHTVIFDPDAPLSDPWTLADDMPPDGLDAEDRPLGRRWYPTGTALSTTELLCTSGGHNFASTPADIPLLLNATNAAGSQYQSLTAAERERCSKSAGV